MTEKSLRNVSATLKYGRHIEFVNWSPGLSQMSSFHVHNIHNRPRPLVRPDEQKVEQDLLQLLIHQQQKKSSTDAETISSLKQQLSQKVSRSVKERESRKENTVSHKQITDQNEPQSEKTRGKP